uniref:NADH-ubiquinone oxidoreductase chain 1 n=1 Tax=Tetraphalerus bruchi TaxID=546504 RepID=B6D8Z5_TETBR|nr:NADH dehydrogenase subunit 1 [Tetraphalerus bruchi]ACF35133.1 NADH dehydrogenase subunit 1 [Tetraphalerus bruchi]
MYFLDFFLLYFLVFVLVICVLIGVAFLTLLERSVLGYIQVRKGPNSVGFLGVLQPFCDAIKLFTSEQGFPYFSNFYLFYFSPVFSLFLSLIVWFLVPYFFSSFVFGLGVLFLLSCLSLGVYTVMVAGWSSNSNYSLLGGLRSVAQTISYEVSLVLILMSVLILISSFDLVDFLVYQEFVWLFFLSAPISGMWFVSSLAETNRTPFDLAEGESELVSGFNVEYSAGGFALIFMAEYSSILFMSFLFIILFFGGCIVSVFFYLSVVLFSFLFLWVRGTLPRFRYDSLMYLAWSSYLPVSLNFMLFYLGISVLMYSSL